MPATTHAHRLDVYQNRQHPTGTPVLLFLHGGGWVMGDKRQQGLPLMLHLAAQGWVCVTANCRLSPKATFLVLMILRPTVAARLGLVALIDAGVPGRTEVALQMHVDDQVPVVFVHVEAHLVLQDSGVVDEDVQVSEGVDGLFDQGG
jgi:hypothetical protein